MMSPHHPSRPIFWQSRGRVVLLGVMGAALLSLLLSLVGAGRAEASTRAPGGNFTNPVVRAVDVAAPAIVRLATIYEGHLELSLCGQTVELPSGGHGYTLGGLGSGAFISANGEILTADHVVHIPKESLDSEIFQSDTSATDIARAINAHASCLGITYRVTAGDIANGYVQYVGIPFTTSYSDPRRLVWQATSYTGPISASASEHLLKALTAAPYQEATLLTSSTFEENDLAVLRVSLTDTPSIQLDDSTDVAVDDQLTIIGFPGNGDVSGNATDLLTPSVNNVSVSAIKSGPNGAKLIQVGGNVEHGDSGGPALDANGHIVGVVSFGGDDPRGNTSFMRSSNNARTLITSAGVSTRPGTFQKLWEQAFADYASTVPGHWHKAASEMDALSISYPSFKGLQTYRTFADAAAQTESTDLTGLPSQLGMLVVVAVALVVIIAVALVLFFVVRRRRSRQAVARAIVSQALPASPYGSTPYGGYPYAPPAAGQGPYGGYAPPTAGGYGGYGNYAPPSSYRQANGVSYVPAEVTAAPSGVTSEVGGPSTLQELGRQELGRTSFPPSSPGNGAVMADATPAMPMRGIAVETPSAGATASASYPPSWTGSTPSAAPEYYCVNGHSMSSSTIYCSVCGAPRRPDSPYSQYSSRP